jgi:plastocyanin
VTAVETEFQISLSTGTFHPGTYTFVALNRGSATHDLVINGSGVNAQTGLISPGNSDSVTVTLQSGTYEIYCSVGTHKMLGMDLSITVS